MRWPASSTATLLCETWMIEQRGWDAAEEPYFQTIFALSNGRIGVRPTADPELEALPPASFVEGFYGPGLAVTSELVSVPDWSYVVVGTPGEWDLLAPSFRRRLCLRTAHLETSYRLRDSSGRLLEICEKLFLPAQDPSLGALELHITPIGWSGDLRLALPFDWRRGNRYMGGLTPQVETHHLSATALSSEPDGFFTASMTASGTGLGLTLASMAMASHTERSPFEMVQRLRYAEVAATFAVRQLETLHLRRIVSLPDGDMDLKVARQMLSSISWTALAARHEQEWDKRWDRHQVEIEGETLSAAEMNFATYQTLQAVRWGARSQNLPARGVTSEYHSGHFFFNTEFFELPYWVHMSPSTARSFLEWRRQRLDSAMAHAAADGRPGARFPEESDALGRPAAPRVIREIFSGRTYTEWSGVEKVFLSGAVVWALARYVTVTQDHILWSDFSEVILECARYSASLFEEGEDGRFHVGPVMGPDEYHYHVYDNFFTNQLLAFAVSLALLLVDAGHLNLNHEEASRWRHMLDNVVEPTRIDGVVEQHAGFFDLPEGPVLESAANGRPAMPPQIAEAISALEVVPHRLVKEGDVLLHALLFPQRWDRASLMANLRYYEPITVHESSLSAVSYGVAAARVRDDELTRRSLSLTVRYDLDYEPRAGHHNGLHLAVYAGTWQILFLGCLGLRVEGPCVHLDPWLPAGLDRIAGNIFAGGGWVRLDFSRELGLKALVDERSTAHVHCGDRFPDCAEAASLRTGKEEGRTS